ncbi:hypothetical protein J3R30DRAFT_3432228 [Lentinula aciculospora]|uniref:HMA domain-containing protein n=1 Tax=Lentinula aciculospora TaxID=153920 RepID=A0A9W9AQ54_9AGAR|nr:hypothetical protein J3R30DRAFT_3432228 [Lentinula aciculospora]
MDDVEYSYILDVKMTCSGCSGAVSRVLEKSKTKGDVNDYSVDLDTQKVIVKSKKPIEDITAIVKKTGKEIRSAEIIV